MKTILVTGANGFLGSHLVRALLDDGYRVAILKRTTSKLDRIEEYVNQIAMFNIEDGVDTPFNVMGTIDAVIHTATSYGRHGETPYQIFEANTAFPLRLMENAVSNGTDLFINTDTILDRFINHYALSKSHFAEWGRQFASSGKIAFANIRLEHMYGPGDDATKFTTHVIRSCVTNVPQLNLTPGEQRRDFIYIDDVVVGYMQLLRSLDAKKHEYSQFDLGSGKAVTIRQFVETVHRITCSTTKLNFGALPYRNNEIMSSEADISTFQSLGWECKTSLEEGIRRTIKQEQAQ